MPAPGEKKEGDTPAPPAEPDPAPKKRYTPKKNKPSNEELEATVRRVINEEREEAPPEKPKEEPAPAEPIADESLDDDTREHLTILSELEKINPARKGAVEQHRKFLKAADAYAAQWEQKNPGEQFDPNSPDHAEFYRKNQPFIPKSELKAAERTMIERSVEERTTKRVEENLRKQIDPEIRAIRAEKAHIKAQPEIEASTADAVEQVFKAVPEFQSLFQPGKLTNEDVKKIAETNPLLYSEVVAPEAERMMVVIEELEKLNHLGKQGFYHVDLGKDVTLSNGDIVYPHLHISKAFVELEQRFSNTAKEELINKGREWIPISEQTRRLEAIEKSALSPDAKERRVEDLKKTTWVVEPEDVREFILKRSARRIAETSKKFAQYGRTTASAASPAAPQTPPPAEPPKPNPKAALADSASITTVSDTVNNSPDTLPPEEKMRRKLEAAAFH